MLRNDASLPCVRLKAGAGFAPVAQQFLAHVGLDSPAHASPYVLRNADRASVGHVIQPNEIARTFASLARAGHPREIR